MLATLTGTLLAPGVSKNNRLYTRENIGRAVARMRSRLADENARPIVMRTHHGAGDDTTRIVAHLTDVELDEATGRARYTAVFNGTQAARDVLAATEDEKNPSLRNVSIYGWWADKPHTVRQDGQAVETADDLEIDAVDFTAFPGVEDARIDSVTPAGERARESTAGRYVITESVEAEVVVVDEAAQPMGKRTSGLTGPGGPYADPGYQKDKKPRYQLDTKAHAKAAWSYVNQAGNAKAYNATQLKAIKGRIRAALKKFGVDVTKESTYAAMLGETTIGECYACDGDRAGFSLSAHNGPINITVSAYSGIDPAELEAIATAAMQAACDALKALDPDMDADIDVDGAPNADTNGSLEDDDSMESTLSLPGAKITPRDLAAFLARKQATESAPVITATPQTPAPTEAGPTVKESAMPDEQKAVEQAATTTETAERPLTAADLNAAVAEALKPVTEAFQALAATVQSAAAAPVAPATESAQADPEPAATPSTESVPDAQPAESTPKAVATEALKEAIPQILEAYGVPPRKGFGTTENTEQASPEQLWENRSQLWNGLIPGGTPAPTA